MTDLKSRVRKGRAGSSPASATFLRVLRLRRLPLSQLISKLTPIRPK
jgi:hypothetical protein